MARPKGKNICPSCKTNPRDPKAGGYCTSCKRKKATEWRNNNRGAYRKSSQESYHKHGEKNRFRSRLYAWKKKYGINLTYNEYMLMFEAQKGRCAICKIHQDETSTFHVDHNHTSGKVRALLCSSCNLALGLVKERPEIMRSMIAYLEVE